MNEPTADTVAGPEPEIAAKNMAVTVVMAPRPPAAAKSSANFSGPYWRIGFQ